tara:strand:+ start:62 stop:235 length:174 start_codon:yes stop_codon:yes gene_type:complete
LKVGDIVSVETVRGSQYGIVVTHEKKMFMVGPVIEVMVDGQVILVKREKVKKVEFIK